MAVFQQYYFIWILFYPFFSMIKYFQNIFSCTPLHRAPAPQNWNGQGQTCLKLRDEIRFLSSNLCFQSIKICTRGFSVWSHPCACDEQSFLFVQSFIISITKRRIEDNYIVWTNQSVRRSIYHGGRVQHLTANDWWPRMSVSGQSSLIWCKLLTVDSNLSCSFFLPLLKTISGFWSSEGVITNVG